MVTGGWRVRHPGIGILPYDSEAEARIAAGTAGRVYAPHEPYDCPTCTGPVRETVGMVCPTCGTDYAPGA